MNYAEALIKDRIGWLNTFIKMEERRLDESLKGSEDLSGHIKQDIAELKELGEALKVLRAKGDKK